jgi:hypothetical protein
VERRATNQGHVGSNSRPGYTTTQSTPARGSSGQQTQQTQATPQASTPTGPGAPNTSTNRSCFKCGQSGHYACGGQISPGSTRRIRDLTKGPRAP